MNTADVARRCGVTYRQVDYWCRTGRVAGQENEGAGAGSRRGWTEAGVRCVAVFARWAALTGSATPPDPAGLRALAETTSTGWAVLTPHGWRWVRFLDPLKEIADIGRGRAVVFLPIEAPPAEVSR